MASSLSFFLGVGLYLALYFGSSGDTTINCTMPDGLINDILWGDFDSSNLNLGDGEPF